MRSTLALNGLIRNEINKTILKVTLKLVYNIFVVFIQMKRCGKKYVFILDPFFDYGRKN